MRLLKSSSVVIFSSWRIKLLLWAMASALATTATAAELQSWPQNKPVSLTPGGHDIQVVNVWATWCAPCRKEMPLLSRWYVKQQQSRAKPKVSMMGVALDSEANIARFVQQTPVRYPLWRYSGTDSTAWMKTLGNSVGALPFTLVRAPQCGFQAALLGEVDEAKLDKAVAQARQQCGRKR